MLSRKTVVVISVVALVVFSVITVETIDNSGSGMTTSTSTGSLTPVQVYSPQNGSAIFVNSADLSFNVSLSITSNESNVYIFDVSPSNVSGLQNIPGMQIYSIPKLTSMNQTLYPYNYQVVNVTSGVNTTFSLTLFLNSTLFNNMNISSPSTGILYPYLVEILVETSSGASGIGFTLIRI